MSTMSGQLQDETKILFSLRQVVNEYMLKLAQPFA